MKKIDKVKWGIIGAGDVCEVKSGPAFHKIEHSELVMVMRRNGEKAAGYAKRHGVGRWTDNAQELIDDPMINAVYIATPPDAHKEYCLKVAAAGKAVYVEKPMAKTYGECQEMIKACEEAQVPLYVAYYRRALPNFLKVKTLIDEKVIGSIRYVDIQLRQPVDDTYSENNWRVRPEIAGGGYFYDLASHQFDFLDFILGPVIRAHGFAINQASPYPSEDMVVGSFHFANGVLGQGAWSFNCNPDATLEVTTIYGSKGKIAFSYFSGSQVELQIQGQNPQIFNFEMPEHIQQPLIQTVVNDLRGEGTCESLGYSAARTNQILEEVRYRIDI